MATNYSQNTIIIPQVDGLDNFRETVLDADIIPVTTTGVDFSNVSVSGQNVFEALQDIVISLNTPNFVQVDFSTGTDLLIDQNELPFNTSSEVFNGNGFTVNSNNVTLSEAGIYKVDWMVSAELQGSTFALRSRNIVTDLNRNSGTFIVASQTAGSVLSVRRGPVATSKGSYIIETTSNNETLGVRSRDFSTDSSNNIDFVLIAGYCKIQRIKRS